MIVWYDFYFSVTTCGDFQERCHSWAAVQAACLNVSFYSSSWSSGSWLVQTTSGWRHPWLIATNILDGAGWPVHTQQNGSWRYYRPSRRNGMPIGCQATVQKHREEATGCPECAKKKMAGKKCTIEQMREIAKNKGGRCLSKNYVNNNSKLLQQCSEGHTPWEATPSHAKTGTWCPECYRLSRAKNSFNFTNQKKSHYVIIHTSVPCLITL